MRNMRYFGVVDRVVEVCENFNFLYELLLIFCVRVLGLCSEIILHEGVMSVFCL